MADPLTALGSAASVLSIIDILARAGKTVMDLSYKWADADFTLLNLSAQMTALRVALSSINTWLRNSADETHHQLVMDIETSLQCCYLLATRIDGQIAGLPKLTDGSLATASKARLILRSSGIAELQDMIERQTSALTLLLTACNSNTLSDQQKLLETPRMRKTIDRAQKDTASLIVNRDVSSLHTAQTDNLSKLSMTFAFDGELFGSKVYQSVIRDPVKRAFRSRATHRRLPSALDSSSKLRMPKHNNKIPVFGTGFGSKSTLVEQLRFICSGYFSEQDRTKWLGIVHNDMRQSLQALVYIFRGQNPKGDKHTFPSNYILPRKALKIASELLDEVHFPSGNPLLKYIKSDIQELMELWATECVPLPTGDYTVPSETAYVIDNIDRLIDPTSYVFSTCYTKDATIRYRICLAEQDHLIYDVGGDLDQHEYWEQLHKHSSIIIFTVDLDNLDSIDKSTTLFSSLLSRNSSDWTTFAPRPTLMLCFTKMNLFHAKEAAEMRSYFPHFERDANPAIKLESLTMRFLDIWKIPFKNRPDLYVHFLNESDEGEVKTLVKAMEVIVRREMARGSSVRVPEGCATCSLVSGKWTENYAYWSDWMQLSQRFLEIGREDIKMARLPPESGFLWREG